MLLTGSIGFTIIHFYSFDFIVIIFIIKIESKALSLFNITSLRYHK